MCEREICRFSFAISQELIINGKIRLLVNIIHAIDSFRRPY